MNVHPHVVACGLWIERQIANLPPQWKYRVRASVSRSRLADIQRMKLATRAGELGLGYNDRHTTVSLRCCRVTQAYCRKRRTLFVDIQRKRKACSVRCESAFWEMGLFQHMMDDLIGVIPSGQLRVIGYYLSVQFRVR